MSYKYRAAILGGTFDHLHLGHKDLIKTAFNHAKNITIGIVEKTFSLDKSFLHNLEPYSTRKANLETYLHEIAVLDRSNLIPIHDIYGTSLTDNTIEAIFVTDSTSQNAKLINLKRQELGLPKIDIVIVPYVLGDDNEIISSSRIRAGEIGRTGQSYLRFFLQKKSYMLPDKLRPILQQPLGTVVSHLNELDNILSPDASIISVGDIVSLDLLKSPYHPALCIIDYRTRRQEISRELIHKYFPQIHETLTNPAGTINPTVSEKISNSLLAYNQTKETQIIKVEGEEDLLSLPAILLAPLDTYIVYGQYNLGMILVKVTEKEKDLVKNYLEQF